MNMNNLMLAVVSAMAIFLVLSADIQADENPFSLQNIPSTSSDDRKLAIDLHGGNMESMCGKIMKGMFGGMSKGMHGGMSKGMHGGMSKGMHGGMSKGMHGGMSKGMFGVNISQGISPSMLLVTDSTGAQALIENCIQ